MSKQRAEELTRIKNDLQEKFAAAVAQIDAKIAIESGAGAESEEAAGYKAVGQAAKELAKQSGTAAGIMALRQFPRAGGPKAQ